MKKNIKYLSIFAGLLFSFYACEFSPSEIPITEIEKPSEIAPDVLIELSPEMDTLRLSEPAWISYSFENIDQKLYQIEFQMDSVKIGNLSYESAKKVRVYIHTNLIEDGMHELKITTLTSTNSGSIADKTGNEVYYYEIKWPVFVNKQAKANFRFNNLVFVPEGIKVSWPEYRYADFDRYEFSLSSDYYKSGYISIMDPRQNSYIDDTYVEGCYTHYSVFVYYTTGGIGLDHLTYYKKIKDPVVQVNKDGSVDIYWTHSKNEKYVKLYCIKTSTSTYGSTEEHDLVDLKDTTLRLNDNIGFGGDYQAQLRYIPQGFNSYHTTLNTAGGVTSFALGDSIPRFQKAIQIIAENSLLIYKGGTFSKYNFLTDESTASMTVTPVEDAYIWTIKGSPDGNYFGYFENQEYLICNSLDLTLFKKIDIEAYDGSRFMLSDISVSNNGLIATADKDNNLRIFDLSTGGKIFEKHFGTNYYLKKAIISPDGENLAVMLLDYNSSIISLVYFSFNSDQLYELGRVNGVGEDVNEVLAYTPQAEHKFIVSRWRAMYEYNVEVRDSRTFELLHYVEVPKFFVPVVHDFTTDRIIAMYKYFPMKKYSYLIDIKTGNQNKTVQFIGGGPLVFTGGNILSGTGRSIGIDNFIIE